MSRQDKSIETENKQTGDFLGMARLEEFGGNEQWLLVGPEFSSREKLFWNGLWWLLHNPVVLK